MHLVVPDLVRFEVLIASFCIDRGYSLLHNDCDFDAFVELRGMHTRQH